jgi:hypothetical protein
MLDLSQPTYLIDRQGHSYYLLDTLCGSYGAHEADKFYSNKVNCKKCRRIIKQRGYDKQVALHIYEC